MLEARVVWTTEGGSKNRGAPSAAMQTIALVACAMASFGFYFSYDVPGVLAGHLKDWYNDAHAWAIDDSHIGLLYSVGTVPSIVGVLLTGAWIDAYGLRVVSCSCVALVLSGSFLFALAAQHSAFALALVGRFVLGLGGDSISVCTNSILCLYFSQKQLVAAIAVVSTVLVLADFSAFTVLPSAARRWGLLSPLWIAVSSCTASLMAIFSFWVFDSRNRKPADAADSGAAADADADTEAHGSILTLLPVVWRLFDARFLLLVGVGALLGATASTFNGFSVDILLHQGLDEVAASQRTSLLSLSNLIATPTLGFLLSGLPPRVVGVALTLALAAVSAAFLYMTFVPGDTSMSLCVVGVAYALLTTGVWPLLPLVSPPKHTGLSFGVAFSTANFCVSVLYWLAGRIIKHSPGLMLQVWCAVALAGAAMAAVWTVLMPRTRAAASPSSPPPPPAPLLKEKDAL